MPPSYLSGSTSSILPYCKWRTGYCILNHSLFMLHRHSSHWFESSFSLYLSVLFSHPLRYRLNVCGTLYQHRDMAPRGHWLGHWVVHVRAHRILIGHQLDTAGGCQGVARGALGRCGNCGAARKWLTIASITGECQHQSPGDVSNRR